MENALVPVKPCGKKFNPCRENDGEPVFWANRCDGCMGNGERLIIKDAVEYDDVDRLKGEQ